MQRAIAFVLALLFALPHTAVAQQTDRQALEAAKTHIDAAKAIIDAQLAQAPANVVVAVPIGASVQDAVNAAEPGTILVLAPNTDYLGSVSIPAKSIAGAPRPVTITTLGWTSKGEGHAGRVTPEDLPRMARIVPTPRVTHGIAVPPGSGNVVLFGIAVDACAPIGQCDMIKVGDGDFTDAAQMAHNVTIRQVLVQGSREFGAYRGILLNGADLLVEQSWVDEIWNGGRDTQAIGAYRGGQRVTVRFNYLAAGAENIIVGGSRVPNVDVIPSDWLVEDNILHKPARWRPLAQGGDGVDRDVKNLFELKIGHRFIVRRNLMVGNWAGAQDGKAILFHYTTNGNCPITMGCRGLTDIMFEDNVVLDTAQGISLQGHAYSEGYNSPFKLQRVRVRNNYVVATTAGGRILQITNVLGDHDFEIDQNTFVNQSSTWLVGSFGWAWIEDATSVTGATRVRGGQMRGLRVTRNAVVQNGRYGITAPDGNHLGVGLAAFAENPVFFGNVVGDMPASMTTRLDGFRLSEAQNLSAPAADLRAAMPADACGVYLTGAGADCSRLAAVFALRAYLPEP